jgi:hypothetical protein
VDLLISMMYAALQVVRHPALSAALLLLLVQTPKAAVRFTTPRTTAEMASKQAVVEVIEVIEQSAVNGETPVSRVDLKSVRVLE